MSELGEMGGEELLDEYAARQGTCSPPSMMAGLRAELLRRLREWERGRAASLELHLAANLFSTRTYERCPSWFREESKSTDFAVARDRLAKAILSHADFAAKAINYPAALPSGEQAQGERKLCPVSSWGFSGGLIVLPEDGAAPTPPVTSAEPGCQLLNDEVVKKLDEAIASAAPSGAAPPAENGGAK